MKFKDKPCNSKTSPAVAVCVTDNSRYPTSGQGLGGMLSPDQNTGPMQGHESAPVQGGSSIILSPWHLQFGELSLTWKMRGSPGGGLPGGE